MRDIDEFLAEVAAKIEGTQAVLRVSPDRYRWIRDSDSDTEAPTPRADAPEVEVIIDYDLFGMNWRVEGMP